MTDSTPEPPPRKKPPRKLEPDTVGPVDPLVIRKYAPFVLYVMTTIGGMIPAATNSSLDLGVNAYCLGFLANMSLLCTWWAKPLGQRIPLYLATVIPTATFYVAIKSSMQFPLGGQTEPMIQTTSVPLLLVVSLIPFLFIQMVTLKKLRFEDSDLSHEELIQVNTNQFSIAHVMGFTFALGFAMAVFAAGDHEQDGIAWELVPILGVGVVVMMFAVLAEISLSTKKPILVMLGVLTLSLAAQYLLADQGLVPQGWLAAWVLPFSLFLPLVVIQFAGGRWEPIGMDLPAPPKPKRPVQRLD